MQLDTRNLKLVPAKCGCEGCFFQDKDECPSTIIKENNKMRLDAFNCSEGDEPMIYVTKEDGSE